MNLKEEKKMSANRYQTETRVLSFNSMIAHGNNSIRINYIYTA